MVKEQFIIVQFTVYRCVWKMTILGCSTSHGCPEMSVLKYNSQGHLSKARIMQKSERKKFKKKKKRQVPKLNSSEILCLLEFRQPDLGQKAPRGLMEVTAELPFLLLHIRNRHHCLLMCHTTFNGGAATTNYSSQIFNTYSAHTSLWMLQFGNKDKYPNLYVVN